jgi:hypothetical protein
LDSGDQLTGTSEINKKRDRNIVNTRKHQWG